MRTVAIVQARMSSSRLPCKSLADLGGRSLLAHVLERAALIPQIDRVVLAIPTEDARFLSHLWPHVVCGPKEDVLARYALAAKEYEADVIVRVTGDCPLFAWDRAGEALHMFLHNYACDRDVPLYLPFCQPYAVVPDGFDAEFFSYAALELAAKEAKKTEREHVTTWMREHVLMIVPNPPWFDVKEPKLSVDTREDLQFVSQVYEALPDKKAGAQVILETARRVADARQ